MKPGTAPSHPVRLMDQVRERVRYLHYSLSTEKTYLCWIRFFIRWQATGGQFHRQAFASPFQYTRCDTALQRICFSRGPIFARCRSCWATAMSAPP